MKEIGWNCDLSIFTIGRIVLSTKTNELGFISQVTIFDRSPSFCVCWISDINNKDNMFICWEFEKIYPSIKYFNAFLTYTELEDICYNFNNLEQTKNKLTILLNEKIKNQTPVEITIKELTA